jgi:DNA-binding LytR/AlgR family response regulator
MENNLNHIFEKNPAEPHSQEHSSKIDHLKNFLAQQSEADLVRLLRQIGVVEGKESFLVFKDKKYFTIQTDQIAFIYIRNKFPAIRTFQGHEYAIAHSLDQVQNTISCHQFFRINRQYLVNINAIKEIEHFLARKLVVKLIVPAPGKLLIAKEKANSFLNWAEFR